MTETERNGHMNRTVQIQVLDFMVPLRGVEPPTY